MADADTERSNEAYTRYSISPRITVLRPQNSSRRTWGLRGTDTEVEPFFFTSGIVPFYTPPRAPFEGGVTRG
jgi:hypothetical protein